MPLRRALGALCVFFLCCACDERAEEARASPAHSLAARRAGSTRVDDTAPWASAAPALDVARFEAPPGSRAAGAVVTVVRVDPARYQFRLLSAKLDGGDPPTIGQWVDRRGVTGAINASMYQADRLTSVGHMREGRRVNNGGWSGDKAVFVAEPTRAGLPRVRILDRSCEDARAIAQRYRLVVQSIRMLDCRGRNVWAPQPRRWSTACVGTDAAGRVLLIHCRKPVRTNDLVDLLLSLPLGLKRLMYVEGGPEAALVVRVGGRDVVSEVGSYAEGGLLAEAARLFLPLPNALAFAPR